MIRIILSALCSAWCIIGLFALVGAIFVPASLLRRANQGREK